MSLALSLHGSRLEPGPIRLPENNCPRSLPKWPPCGQSLVTHARTHTCDLVVVSGRKFGPCGQNSVSFQPHNPNFVKNSKEANIYQIYGEPYVTMCTGVRLPSTICPLGTARSPCVCPFQSGCTLPACSAHKLCY